MSHLKGGLQPQSAMKLGMIMILPSSHSPARMQDHAMRAARRDPRRGSIPVELIRCQPLDDFPMQFGMSAGVSRTNRQVRHVW